MLGPETVRELLEQRVRAQEDRLTALCDQAPPGMPRLFLIEDEYRAAILTAEINWLRGVIDDLATGRFTWDLELITQTLEQFSRA